MRRRDYAVKSPENPPEGHIYPSKDMIRIIAYPDVGSVFSIDVWTVPTPDKDDFPSGGSA